MNPSRRGNRSPTLFSAASALALLLLTLTGCFSSGDEAAPEGEAKELKAKDAAESTEAPETDLLVTSKKLYQSSMYTVSRDSLQSLQDRYPMGAYAQFATIKLADSYFFNREYIQASKLYEDFIKSYPGSPDLPYVKLQAARSNAFSARGTGRDRSPLEKALVLYDELADRYPTTEYGKVAEQERRTVVQQLSDYDRLIIEFYAKRENPEAAAARQKLFDERWGSRLKGLEVTAVSEKPLQELRLGNLDVPPQIEAAGDLQGASASPASDADERTVVQRVECFKEKPRYVLIEVTELPTKLRGSLATEQIKPRNGEITISRFKVKSEQLAYDCFESGDLRLTPAGDIVLKTKSEMLLTTVDNPARILLTIAEP